MSETTTKRVGSDFRAAAEAHRITKWQIHACSLCGYPCSFLFRGDEVFYDAGCDCVTMSPEPYPRSWNSVAEHYNLQSHPETIAKYDAFWHFTEAPVHA